MNYVPGLWLFILASIICIVLIGATFHMRRTPLGKAYLMFILLALFWTVTFILETASQERDLKILFVKLQFISICLLPGAWLYLALSYLGGQLKKGFAAALAAVPAATLFILWVIPAPNWFWGNPQLVFDQAPFVVMDYDYRWWFYGILMPYTYLLFVSAGVLLIQALFRLHKFYRNQIIIMILAFLLPLLTNLLYILGLSPIPHYNSTTAVFSISGLLIAWALFRYKFLDLVPTARDTVIDQMGDGVIVLDMKHRIVDINPAARQITRCPGQIVGVHLAELQEEKVWSVIEELVSGDVSRAQVEIEQMPHAVFDIQLSHVTDKSGTRTGVIVTLRDTTERVQLFNKVQKLATQDGLTGLLNRRHLLELGEKALESRKPVSLIMFDIDKFKIINDTYGHEAGDNVLLSLADYCRSVLKPEHLLGRIGGDEFAIFLPGTELPAALPVAYRIIHGIQAMKVPTKFKLLTFTISMGVSSTTLLEDTGDMEQLFSLADRAMYQAKQRGRNQVLSAEFLVRG